MRTLYTYGYQQSRSERIIKELIAVRTPQVDIRYEPNFGNYSYVQAAYLARPGIIYYHLVELGNERFRESQQSETPIIQIYQPEVGLIKLNEILEQHGRAAIFCACASKSRCHRMTVAEMAIEKLGVKVIHL